MPDYRKLWDQTKHEFLGEEIKNRKALLGREDDPDLRIVLSIEIDLLEYVLQTMNAAEKQAIITD